MKNHFEKEKLFKEVDKYLYDNVNRTKITTAWVSINCDAKKRQVLIEELWFLKNLSLRLEELQIIDNALEERIIKIERELEKI